MTGANRRPALSSVAAAVALALGTFGIDAAALSLGRLNVLSSLGEPLRAEVELSDVTAAEADGLRVRIPSVEAFRAIGVPYNSALADVQANVQRRGNGRYVVVLSSSRQMADPFIDVLLEANGSSGRVFRDYTVLIDPPGARPVPPPALAAAPAPAPRPAPSNPVNRENAPAPESRQRAAPAPVTAQRPVAPPSAPVERAAAPVARSAGGGSGRQVTVRPGDTASRIANATRPQEISLDQMLVALLRANPDAFMEGNLNRVRAGAVMDVPDAAQAGAMSPQEARRAVIAHSRDFGDYRGQLAQNAPAVGAAPAGRQVIGRLQAEVEARTAGTPADRLTVAPGGVPVAPAGNAVPPSGAGTSASPPAGTVSGAAPVAAGAPGATGAAGTASAPVAGAQGPSADTAAPAAVAASGTGWPSGAASDAAAVLSSPAASGAGAGTGAVPGVPGAPAVRAPTPVPAAAEPEQAWYDAVLDNPVALGGLGVIGLLVAWLAFRLNGRRRRDAAESVFLESNMPRDSFFAASGGESVDTRNRTGSLAASLSYSPSHVDAADVDPVAEADVYLAYGRDLQAEEILREALRANPERVAIHMKLLEIHAKRRDLRAYEGLAMEVRNLTGATGGDWTRVTDMGRELDPGNPMYEAGGRSTHPATAAAAALAATAAADAASATAFAPPPASSAFASGQSAMAPPLEPVSALPPVFTSQTPAFVPSVTPLDFDLDLDRPDTLQPEPAPVRTSGAPASPRTPAAARPAQDTTMPMSLPAAAPEQGLMQGRFVSTMPHPPREHSPDQPLTIDLAQFDTEPAELEMVPRPPQGDDAMADYPTLRAGLPEDSDLIDFDLRDVSHARSPAAADTVRAGLEEQRQIDSNPQAIKLSLARELQAMGDIDGARSLIEEVEAESSGELQRQARQMLTQLG